MDEWILTLFIYHIMCFANFFSGHEYESNEAGYCILGRGEFVGWSSVASELALSRATALLKPYGCMFRSAVMMPAIGTSL